MERELSVLEPYQTQMSLAGQIQELADQIRPDSPLALVGHSWGGMLAALTAAEYPSFVRRLIPVGCGSVRDGDGLTVKETRLRGLGEPDAAVYQGLLERLSAGAATPEELALLGSLAMRADRYDAVPDKHDDPIDVRTDIHQAVWPEVAALRARGGLAQRVGRIACPVLDAAWTGCTLARKTVKLLGGLADHLSKGVLVIAPRTDYLCGRMAPEMMNTLSHDLNTAASNRRAGACVF